MGEAGVGGKERGFAMRGEGGGEAIGIVKFVVGAQFGRDMGQGQIGVDELSG